jgi:uncharacterized protein (TIGR02679 family)
MEQARADLRSYLERPALARLWPAARERLERLGRVGGTVRLPAASEAERRAVADLLGLGTLPGEEVAVAVSRLDRALRSSRFAVSLPEALELLGGPLRDLPAEREAEAERREALWGQMGRHPLVAARPELNGWLEDLRASGLLHRLAAPGGGVPCARELLQGALRVLATLLGEDGAGRGLRTVRLGVLARETLGSSHALDPGSPVATLVLRALARLAGEPPPGNAAERRTRWEAAGVVLDELSSHVLVLGLAPAGTGQVAQGLRALAQAGEPAHWTLRQLSGLGARSLAAGLTVHACENPVVVAAAADRLGSRCPPLVCLEGVPGLAVRKLLAVLVQRGGRIRYHGDFDWPGLRIARILAAAVPWEPWRFRAEDYRQAVTAAEGRPRNRAPQAAPLTGEPVETPWDPALAAAMAETGVAVEEEAVLEDLLEDLGS